MSSLCPLYPRKRTLIERDGMSALCQKQTFPVHSITPRCRTVAFQYLASDCYRLRLRPDGSQEYSYGNSDGNFEEPMDGDHPWWLGTRYEHDDG
jgi:hypothetical protein